MELLPAQQQKLDLVNAMETELTVENLIRESFWSVYRPGCQEHFVIHRLREDPAFVKELDLVMEQDGRLIGVVTHVFLNQASRGYCLYAEWMADALLQNR